MKRILLAGESWMIRTTETKGVDEFTVCSYEEAGIELKAALRKAGYEVEHMPAHMVPTQFPETIEELQAYDLVILSDIGANSLQLAPDVFQHSIVGKNRIQTLSSWVQAGGALLMIGGYLSFTGFEAKANYAHTALADVLPVTMLTEDDRIERPEGVTPHVLHPEHPALGGAGDSWPRILGYNKVKIREGAELLAVAGDDQDPLVAVSQQGKGRSAVFTSDCAPHWAPPEFSQHWDGYDRLFAGLADWLTRQ
ncbi:glutamine amidotransferase [Bifidobacterium aquikefiricola]|uniref:Glutamine amidotransferase n=1 Tax=Bifidobacterium aquikefiricola TaxID=3059038 RepID=A0AB39U5S0_9BIFI